MGVAPAGPSRKPGGSSGTIASWICVWWRSQSAWRDIQTSGLIRKNNANLIAVSAVIARLPDRISETLDRGIRHPRARSDALRFKGSIKRAFKYPPTLASVWFHMRVLYHRTDWYVKKDTNSCRPSIMVPIRLWALAGNPWALLSIFIFEPESERLSPAGPGEESERVLWAGRDGGVVPHRGSLHRLKDPSQTPLRQPAHTKSRSGHLGHPAARLRALTFPRQQEPWGLVSPQRSSPLRHRALMSSTTRPSGSAQMSAAE